ncbi:hypothetical protein K2X33_02685 [bacterium]|nr:hypothetical protein [bacterium]
MLIPQTRSETLAWLCLLFALSGAVVWVRTATVKSTYHYVQQEKEIASVTQQLQDFRIRWLRLTAPKRLESLAPKFELAPTRPNQRVQYVKGAVH